MVKKAISIIFKKRTYIAEYVLNAKQVQGFKIVMDDNNDCRREVFPSFFTGKSLFRKLGFSTMPGFKISMSGRGRGVDVFDFSL